MSTGAVPRLDLAPKRTQPLSLWNPLDYLVLLYWCFFFPQALKWYEARFCAPIQEVRSDSLKPAAGWMGSFTYNLLVFQCASACFLSAALLLKLIEICGPSVDWFAFLAWTIIGLGLFLLPYLIVAFGVDRSVRFLPPLTIVNLCASVGGSLYWGGVPGGIFGVTYDLLLKRDIQIYLAAESEEVRFLVTVVLFLWGFGLAASTIARDFFDFYRYYARLLTFIFFCALLLSLLGYMLYVREEGFSSVDVLVFPLVFLFSLSGIGILLIFGFTRSLDWILAGLLGNRLEILFWSRVVWLPFPPLKRHLQVWLTSDWNVALGNVSEILKYSYFFQPAISAVNATLASAKQTEIISRVSRLTEEPAAALLLRFGSSNLEHVCLRLWAESFPLLPLRWRGLLLRKYSDGIICGTPASCVCLGFACWYERNVLGAVDAFEKVRNLHQGAELHGIAMAIAKGSVAENLAELVVWKGAASWLDDVDSELLRPATIAALRELRAIALEGATAHQAHAPLNRAGALGRAAARLNAFISAEPGSLPEPEGPLLTAIAKRWLDVILKAGGAVGEAVLREPIVNPYGGYSGLPARDHLFVGRDDILRNIETLWTTGDVLPTIFLFGHRRMGKTSILRHLEATVRPDTLIIYLDMQDVGWVEDTAELLRDFAEAIHRKATEAHLDPGEPPSEQTYPSLDRARRSINKLLDRLDPQLTGRRLILAIDEFELIEEGIQKGRLDPGVLPWLRSRAQRHRWLGIIFGGLHTLEEMGGDYQKAFFSQTENVRVTYLTRKDFDRLVTQPHPDFALEYAQDLLDEIYRLTHGQPFLVQRLCWELVTRWNERFLDQGETTPRILTLADLDPVLDSDFFKNAEYYFDGVWKNVTEEERQLMTLLATREQPWPKTDLTAAGREDLASVLSRLSRHDVILETDGEIRFASELMRRWVALQGGGALG